MKTKQRQRRSVVAYILWSGVIIFYFVTVINLVDEKATPGDRLFALVAMAGAIILSYWAGRWRGL